MARVGFFERGIVGAHGGEMLVEQVGQQMAHLKGVDVVQHRPGRAPLPGLVRKALNILDEAAVAALVEQADQVFARLSVLGFEFGRARAEALPGQRHRSVSSIGFQLADHHVEVAHCAKRLRDFAHFLQIRIDGFRFVIVRQQAEGAAHPPDGDAHIVNFFGVFAHAAAGFVLEHFDKIVQQRFAPGFRHRILRPESAGLALADFRVECFMVCHRIFRDMLTVNCGVS